MKMIKSAAKAALKRFDRRLVSVAKSGPTGVDLEHDFAQLLPGKNPMVFDVGANRGQSIDMYRECLDDPVIHSFEPSTKMLEYLANRRREEGAKWDKVSIHSVALGSSTERRDFRNYKNSFLSSLLELEDHPENPFLGDRNEIASVEEVSVVTLDDFVAENKISQIDMLKIDTQGFDLQVLKGAEKSLKSGLIKYIFLEMNFVKMYEGQGGATQLIEYLAPFERYFIDMYEIYRPLDSHRMAWASGLFGPK